MSVTQLGKYREILVVYCSAREAGILIHGDIHQDFSEVLGQRKISKETVARDNGKKRWLLPSIFPMEK